MKIELGGIGGDIMLDKLTMIRCGWCGSKDTAVNWDKLTYSECKSREMRRLYTPIFKEKTFNRNADTFYKCPNCGTWSRGSQLAIVDTKDKRLLKLGREPLIKEIPNK